MILSVTILLCAALVLTIVSYRRSHIPKNKKSILLIIRSLMIIAVWCAFFQPSFTISRLASRSNTLAVLVDLSTSMQLFYPDTIVTILSSRQDKTHPSGRTAPASAMYGFGDSLRKISSLSTRLFTDKTSSFPSSFSDDRLLSTSKKILIVSDGNWSHSLSDIKTLLGKECYYLRLQQSRIIPYLHCETDSRIQSTTADTSAQIHCMVSGYSQTATSLRVRCRKGSHILTEKNIPVDSGSFSESVTISLPPQKAGTHLLTLGASMADTVTSSCMILHRVTPQNLTAYCYARHASLDKRFISLAFERSTEWSLLKPEEITDKAPDVLVLCDWDSTAAALIRRFNRSSTVFIGTLPASTVAIPAVGRRVQMHTDIRHNFSTHSTANFPPLSSFLEAPRIPYSIQRVLFTYDTTTTFQEVKSPLLFEAFFNNRLSLMFAGRGLWRWDFWPQSLANDRKTPLFSDFIINQIKELVQYNTNDEFYVYPDRSGLSETDSLSFKVALPSYLLTYPEVVFSLDLLTTGADTVYHAKNKFIPYLLNTHPVKTAPLKAGRYIYICSVRYEKELGRVRDSITIASDITELRVQGQNTMLLNEIASPVTPERIPELLGSSSLAGQQEAAQMETVPKRFSLHRTWYMLGALFLLLGVEWLLRRLWRLD